MSNEERDVALYRWPNSSVLRNKLNVKDQDKLDIVERLHVTRRIAQGIPAGQFDLNHLKSIHHHLFQDIYDWAGEIRQVDMNKGGQWFHPHDRIEMGMADIHKRLCAQECLKGLSRIEYAKQAGVILGDINALHPFREGNGRTQLLYLKQLTNEAGHNIDLTKLTREPWIEASIKSHAGDYSLMQEQITNALGRSRNIEKSR